MSPGNILRLLVLLAATSSAARQTQNVRSAPTAPEVQALLRSSNASDQAWGAYWSSQLRLSFPEIRQNLEACLKDFREIPDFAVIDNSLDALIQNPSDPLPVDLIESLYPFGRTAEALILLTRVTPGPQTDNFLLKLLDQEGGKNPTPAWYAAADIMLSEHRPTLVHSLVRGLSLTAYVVVCDPGNPCNRRGSRTFVDGPPDPATDFGLPPWPTYVITPPNTGTLSQKLASLSGAPVSFAYTRRVGKNYWDATRGRNPGQGTTDPTRDRLLYVSAAAPSVVMTITQDETHPILWTDLESYRRESKDFENDIRTRYAALIKGLRDKNFLTPEEFANVSTPNLRIVIDDQRSNKTLLP